MKIDIVECGIVIGLAFVFLQATKKKHAPIAHSETPERNLTITHLSPNQEYIDKIVAEKTKQKRQWEMEHQNTIKSDTIPITHSETPERNLTITHLSQNQEYIDKIVAEKTEQKRQWEMEHRGFTGDNILEIKCLSWLC